MSDIAIRVESLGKSYRLGNTSGVHTLRDTLTDILSRRRQQKPFHTAPFWALKDVSFTLEQGVFLKIIGRNGSGKITLLKLLPRITRPNEVFLEVHGGLGSILNREPTRLTSSAMS